MKNLVEHVLNEDYVNAQEIFESRIHDIMEVKLHEMKKMMQAEVFGGLTAAQIQARKELGWKKAADVLEDPRERRTTGGVRFAPPKKKIVAKKKIKEEIDRSEVEAEKEKLKAQGKAYPEYPTKGMRIDTAPKGKSKTAAPGIEPKTFKQAASLGLKSVNVAAGQAAQAALDKTKSAVDKVKSVPGSIRTKTLNTIADPIGSVKSGYSGIKSGVKSFAGSKTAGALKAGLEGALRNLEE